MSIKKKLQLSVIVTGGMALLVFGLILVWTSRQVSEAIEQSKAIDKVVRGVFELNIITNDYLLYHEERAQAQWQLRYSSLAQILTEVGAKYPEEEILDRVIQNHAEIQPLFSQLVTNYEGQGLSELEQRLASQLAMNAQTMVADTFRLAETASARAESAQGRGSFLLMASGVIILTLMVSTIILVSNDIVARITNLHRGTEIIAAGDLDYQVDVGNRDEIGDLAHAFNEMTRQLRESYGALKEEITERKQAEEALTQSEEKYRLSIDKSHDAIFAIDVDTAQIIDANLKAEELTGYSKEELLKLKGWDVHPVEEKEGCKEKMRQVIEGRGITCEMLFLRKDGSTVPADVSSNLIEYGDKRFIQRICRDITERKRAEEALKEYSERLEEMVEERTKELLEAQEQLIRKEKLAILGQLAGGVAHELRNPLGVISNAVYYLKTILPDADETTKEYLEMISSEVRNSEKMVSDLLDLSRTRLPVREEITVSDLVGQALEKRPPPEKVKVTTKIASDLPPVFVDPRQIGQVLVNLVTNAYQAMPEGGRLTISTQAENRQVYLSISDTGCGIPEENMERLFEPLFTTKARGIGLGLAVSKNLVEANGGSIEVESPSTSLRTGEEGKGSTFTVILPTKEGQA